MVEEFCGLVAERARKADGEPTLELIEAAALEYRRRFCDGGLAAHAAYLTEQATRKAMAEAPGGIVPPWAGTS